MSYSDRFDTHIVENQPIPPTPYNLWSEDPMLLHWTQCNSIGEMPEVLHHYGQLAGHSLMDDGEHANKHKPELHLFDRYGRRRDEVHFHPSYHRLMDSAMSKGVHNYSWQHKNKGSAHIVRAALLFMHCQADAGTTCPLTMTHAAVPALKQGKHLPPYWLEKLVHGQYDPRDIPAMDKAGVTIGMGMTEKQGGSDVRRNTTKAIPNDDGSYSIIGHKFFFSAPMCDAHLILAQTEGGLSCFLLPRILENGQRNHVRIQRLKDKLGDWSNASSEVEFTGATGFLIGEEGRGVPVIIDMVSLTRLDCMIGSSALMRQGLVQAVHHVSEREAFGKRLIEQPLMKNVIADLTLECASHVALTMRVAKAVDAAENDNTEAAFARIATAIGKYWICKRTATFINEAQECLGGIGYVEENILPRLYRQAPLNSIWEGSGNVQCLDVLRAIAKDPQSKHALFQELTHARGKNRHYDNFVVELTLAFNQHEDIEVRSRLLTEKTALALQAAQLLKHGEGVLADAFCESRLSHQHGMAFGTLPAHVPFDDIIATGLVTPRQ